MSLEFSADAERTALDPWSIRVDGRVYVAAPVSRPQLGTFLAVVHRKDPAPSVEEVEGAVYRLLRAAFPRRLRYWWSGDPVLKILALDYRVRESALHSFFESLGLYDDRPSAPGTNGMNGSPPSSGDANGSRPAPPAGGLGAGSPTG